MIYNLRITSSTKFLRNCVVSGLSFKTALELRLKFTCLTRLIYSPALHSWFSHLKNLFTLNLQSCKSSKISKSVLNYVSDVSSHTTCLPWLSVFCTFTCFTCSYAFCACMPKCLCLLRAFLFSRALRAFLVYAPSFVYVPYMSSFFYVSYVFSLF